MTVVFQEEQTAFNVSKVLYADKAFLTAVVRHFFVSQTEAHIDMACDSQDQMPELRTRDGIQAMLGDIPDSAEQYAADVCNDLRHSILEAIRNARYGAAVTGIKYDLGGNVVDVEVDLSVS